MAAAQAARHSPLTPAPALHPAAPQGCLADGGGGDEEMPLSTYAALAMATLLALEDEPLSLEDLFATLPPDAEAQPLQPVQPAQLQAAATALETEPLSLDELFDTLIPSQQQQQLPPRPALQPPVLPPQQAPPCHPGQPQLPAALALPAPRVQFQITGLTASQALLVATGASAAWQTHSLKVGGAGSPPEPLHACLVHRCCRMLAVLGAQCTTPGMSPDPMHSSAAAPASAAEGGARRPGPAGRQAPAAGGGVRRPRAHTLAV